MPDLPVPTGATSQRRRLPFQVPPELKDAHPAVQAHVKLYDDLVAKREAHLDRSDRVMLEARDALVKALGADHQAVAQMNSRIMELNGLWPS